MNIVFSIKLLQFKYRNKSESQRILAFWEMMKAKIQKFDKKLKILGRKAKRWKHLLFSYF